MSDNQDPWMGDPPSPENPDPFIEERIKDPEFVKAQLEAYKRARSETREAYEELLQRLQLTPIRRINRGYYYISGVAAALVFAIAGYLLLHRSTAPVPVRTALVPSSVLPAQNGASLRLSNGRIISLNAGSRGVVATEAGNPIHIGPDGSLDYQTSTGPGVDHPTNTLSTAKGQRFHVVLPDGSQVWLNAGSSLTYFARVGQKDTVRQAELEGEAYFEIAPDRALPFRLSAGGTETVVLGTEFNVKAYPEESKVAVTLLKGAVRVGFTGKTVSLIPGQEAVVLSGKTLDRLDNLDANLAIAWKEGYFSFDGTLDEVARELGRWYDVDIHMKPGAVFRDTVVARTSREVPLDSVLHRLEDIGAGHFTVEGRSVTVMP